MDFSDQLSDITYIGTQGHHTCVMGASIENENINKIFCTGANHYGQIGNGTQSNVTTPVEIPVPL